MRKRSDGTITRVALTATLSCMKCGRECSGREAMLRNIHTGRCGCSGELMLVSSMRPLGGKYQ